LQDPIRSVGNALDQTRMELTSGFYRTDLIDFGQLRVGSSEFDAALAWARLRLLGGGLRPGLARRLSAVVQRPPWPTAGVAWRANALVIVAWYDLVRFDTAPRGVRDLRRAALRRAVRNAVDDLRAEVEDVEPQAAVGPR